MRNSSSYMTKYIQKRFTVFSLALALFFCGLFAFAQKARANGNVSADLPPEPPAKKSVQRAPVRRPPRQAAPARPASTQPAAAPQPQPIPSQPSSLEMGIKMMETGRYKAAHQLLQKAVQEERGNPYAWYWYGMAHDKAGHYDQAQLFYAKALELDPAFPPFSRVLVYPEDGDRKALWDPIRPARVYPIELGDQNVTTVPPNAPESTPRQPVPYVDPVLPKAPGYVPPEAPIFVSGDALTSPRYIPPEMSSPAPVYAPSEQVQEPAAEPPLDGPVYVPPSPDSSLDGPVYVPPPPQR